MKIAHIGALRNYCFVCLSSTRRWWELREIWVGGICWMILPGENRSTRTIICLNDTLSLTNHTWTGPFSTPVLRGESRR